MQNKPQIWKHITLGIGHKTANDFRLKILYQKNGCIRKGAYEIIDNSEFTVSKESKVISLVKISVKELGFNEKTTYKLIKEKALSLGLSLCPPEVGPQLRIQYSNQRKKEYLSIGMEEVQWESLKLIFSVHHDSLSGNEPLSLELCTREADRLFYPENIFVFMLQPSIDVEARTFTD